MSTAGNDGGIRIADLLRLDRDAFRAELDRWTAPGPDGESEPLAPIDGRTEVWAAGVTYVRSREARKAESDIPDVYELVYEAERPELFFKSAAWRVVGPDAPIAIRRDSAWNVPEPELAVVCNADGAIVGYTICNDVSSRTSRARTRSTCHRRRSTAGACAVGPAIVPWWEIDDPYGLEIRLRIRRDGDVVWAGSCSTAQLHRRLDDLLAFLFREEVFPDGVILSTGTGIVPDDSLTLEAGDVVEIDIDRLGTLRNRVVAGKLEMDALR